jgi:predicted nuclease of predicted toxin-antitoxin system
VKFLADESTDFPIVKALREKGVDLIYISEISAGISDEEVLMLANESERVLLTADKDFGELVFRLKRINKGVILYRLSGLTNQEKVQLITDAFSKYLDSFENNFTIINKTHLRIKRFP